MPTADRREFIPAAMRLFLAQDYAHSELIIVDDGAKSIADLIPSHERIRYIRSDKRLSVGAKRNIACEAAVGDIVLHWDDDDWYGPSRIRYQVGALVDGGLDACGIDRAFFVDPALRQAWEYVYPHGGAPWVHGATLCYRKSFWCGNHFPEVNVGEDTRFVFAARSARIQALDDNGFFVGRIHAANTSPKRTRDRRWEARPLEQIHAIVGPDWAACFGGTDGGPALGTPRRMGTALVSAAAGIGDIIRVTPLIRVAHRLGYDVDVLLSPDEPAAIELLRGAPEIRRLVAYPDVLKNRGSVRLSELDGTHYDLATFTTWSAPLSRWIKAERSIAFEHDDWLSSGDSASVEKIARALGWAGALPPAFAMKSSRHFALPPDTVALHPGCKPNWPWKKWHGFDELAAHFPSVVLVGTAADLDNSRTYFTRSFAWPEHVQNFIGKLDLRDTAALLSECVALVSLDSGLMHLGVAVGIPTFGIFGVTSPARECIPSPFMIPISKQLPCEPACRRAAWGRRDCERQLECLKMLSAQEVAVNVTAALPGRTTPQPAGPRVASAAITLNYFGEVFDATGYGEAARAYVRALHTAGVRVLVTHTGATPAQVEDELVSSLLGRDADADFNLFHGIPTLWARSAYPLRNVIAMTVWETDRMPQTWRNPLSHSIDVWLPCAFNVDVFTRDLGRAPHRLPHALPVGSNAGDPKLDANSAAQLGVEPGDFVFYSIFEWQDRKHPRGLVEAFLCAFPDESDAVLVIKTSARNTGEAQRTVAELRGTTGSHGRVVLHCESFEPSRLRALHARGDCYVSLHRGEGWGYPLFEAACGGKPVVATAYAGPLDYLDPERHWLVRHRLTSVRQPYVFYHPSMKWAEPDLAHAREGLRWVYEHRAEARAGAAEAARRLRASYSLERIGAAAKARLVELLKRSNPERYAAIVSHERAQNVPATLPIPGEWYDADYFEYGLKSNWQRGYTWSEFEGVFSETAAFLNEIFPDARTYLDAGCAKGFLVHSLRGRGLEATGFDHSPWAIAGAHERVKPHLELASAQTVDYAAASADILISMSLLESLTEEQIRAFLPRARRWVRQAIFATIPSGRNSDDRDLSHIMLRERTWWHERFIEAGWRQDPLHRAFERQCERHELPKKMSWNVYVFAPGP